ncbi:MAG: DUF4190 domain-containing protein, partial [Clostridia bacterium]|nr:DUF4190 domain-containing protein [Clostridia bacterium]
PNGQPPINNVNQGYQPNNGQQGWQQNGQPNYGYPAQPKRTNGFAIAGFVVSLVSLYLGVYLCIAPIVGLVLSIVGITKSKQYSSCNGLAIAGLVISIITLCFWGLIWLILGWSIFMYA